MSITAVRSVPRTAAPATPERPPLRRPRECAISGVCAGLATHLGAPVWAVRALFVVLSVFGVGVLLYAWFWALVPWGAASTGAAASTGGAASTGAAEQAEPAERSEQVPTRRAPVAWPLLVAAGAGTVFLLGGGYAGFSYGAAVLVLVATVLTATSAGMWAALIDRRDPARGPRHALAVRIMAAALLAIVFALMLSLLAGGGGMTQFVLTMLPLIGLVIVLTSTLIEKWRELSGERIRRIREEQRSEMAAHLHDSVLQTLALIQNRAGASSEAARLARAQERELRAWLYDGDAPADSDLSTDLRDYAGGLELDYPVRIDVVSAGLSTERASGELAASAREAMLNAARHAGGDVSVYIEGGATGVDVFIRDRGTGFDLDAVPGDRLGVRESVIGRMRRAGGSATVRSDAGGTEVHLRIVGTGDVRGH